MARQVAEELKMGIFDNNEDDLLSFFAPSVYGQPANNNTPSPLMPNAPQGQQQLSVPSVPKIAPQQPSMAANQDAGVDVGTSAPAKPDLRKYLFDKYFGSELNDDALKAAQDKANSEKGGLRLAEFMSGVGDAIAGKGDTTSAHFDKLRQGIQDKNVGQLERRRKGILEDLQAKDAFTKAQQQEDQNNPNSDAAKTLQMSVGRILHGKFTKEELARITPAMAPYVLQPAELQAKLDEARATAQLRNQMLEMTKSDKASKEQDKTYSDLTDKSLKPRGNQEVQQAMLGQAAVSKMKELLAKYPNLDDMPQSDVNLFRTELAKAAGGGVATENMMKELGTPSTWSHVKNFISMRTNEPLGADLGKFLQNNKNYVEGLEKVNNNIVNKYQKDLYTGYRGRLRPDQQDEYVKEHPGAFRQEQGPSQFPMQVRKDGHVATVKSADELKEAQAEGWQ